MQACQDPHGGLAVPLFRHPGEQQYPHPDPAGTSPWRGGLTTEAVLLRSCNKELGRGLRHPCLLQGRKLSPRVYAGAVAMLMMITRGALPPLSSWPGCREKEGWNPSALNAASVGSLPCCYVNHEIFLSTLAKGSYCGQPHSWGGEGSGSLWVAPRLRSLGPATPPLACSQF